MNESNAGHPVSITASTSAHELTMNNNEEEDDQESREEEDPADKA